MSERLNALVDKVRVFDDHLPKELYEELSNSMSHIGWKFGWRAPDSESHRYWHHEIGYGAKSNTKDITEKVQQHPLPVFAAYVAWLRKALVAPEDRLVRLYLNAHTFGTDGFPHTDTDREGDLTLVSYLTPVWKPEWCGETVVFDQAGNITAAVMPRPNRIMTFPSNVLHSPRPLAKEFFGLRIVLVAKFSPE